MIEIVQVCDRCKKTRTLPNRVTNVKDNREQGGWRVLNGKDICAEDIGAFLNGVGA